MDAPLTIRLFGPMLVRIGDEPLPRMRSRKASWLLALLSTRANRPVARKWVASTLWPDVDLSIAFANMRPALSELRQALGVHGARIRTYDRHTIGLDLEGVDLDVARFDDAIRHQNFGKAVALYQGPFLEDCGEEWVPQERIAREIECLRALELLGERALAGEDYEQALVYFGRATTIDAWRDAPRRGQMQAFAGKGNANAALQVYREFAHLLSSRASAVPDVSTTELYRDLRERVRQGGIKPLLPQRPPAAIGYLPFPLTEFVGRRQELSELAQGLPSARLLTLVGSGGMGKTRLALEVARRTAKDHPDGVWFVALEGLEDPEEVPREVARTLGISGDLVQALRDRHLLLVLDNCEHVLSAVAEMTAGLLREAAGLRVLATSREAMGLAGERIWPVRPLAVPMLPVLLGTAQAMLDDFDGVRLFEERAKSVVPSFAVSEENVVAVATLCAQVEGVPLALELAASRLRAHTPQQVVDRLMSGFDCLASGPHSRPKRHQTLRSTFDWSYNQLSSRDQILMRQLAHLTDDWTLEDAVSAVGEDAIDGLGTLVGKSLLVFDPRWGSFRWLESVRQYALERLIESCEESPSEESGSSIDRAFYFDAYRFVPARQLLLRHGEPLRIGARALDLLHLLVQRAGELVSKDELIRHSWPELFVHENNLMVNIAALRKALPQASGLPCIVTIPGRGYRFVASVRVEDRPLLLVPALRAACRGAVL